MYAQGLANLLINSAAAIYTEVEQELGIDLPDLLSSQIFVGAVDKKDPKLLTITHEFTAAPQAQYSDKTLSLNCIIRSGQEGSPALQSVRSAGYIAVVERLICSLLTEGRRFKYLIDSWPAQLDGESAEDYASRKFNYQKAVRIEFASLSGLPSNDPARALSGYEGGISIQLRISSSAR